MNIWKQFAIIIFRIWVAKPCLGEECIHLISYCYDENESVSEKWQRDNNLVYFEANRKPVKTAQIWSKLPILGLLKNNPSCNALKHFKYCHDTQWRSVIKNQVDREQKHSLHSFTFETIWSVTPCWPMKNRM